MIPSIMLLLTSCEVYVLTPIGNLTYDYESLVRIGLFHFLFVQGDGRKIPGLVKSMNFQRSTAKSPKIPGGWQHFATKFIEIEIFTLTDFSRQSCR